MSTQNDLKKAFMQRISNLLESHEVDMAKILFVKYNFRKFSSVERCEKFFDLGVDEIRYSTEKMIYNMEHQEHFTSIMHTFEFCQRTHRSRQFFIGNCKIILEHGEYDAKELLDQIKHSEIGKYDEYYKYLKSLIENPVHLQHKQVDRSSEQQDYDYAHI